jgi:hypothetical protein
MNTSLFYLKPLKELVLTTYTLNTALINCFEAILL